MIDWDELDRRLEQASALILSSDERRQIEAAEQEAYQANLPGIRRILSEHISEMRSRGFSVEFEKIERDGLKILYAYPGFYGPGGFASQFHPAGPLVLGSVDPKSTSDATILPNDIQLNTFLGQGYDEVAFIEFVAENLTRYVGPANQILSPDQYEWIRAETWPAASAYRLTARLRELESMSDSGPVLRRRRGTEFEQFLFNVLDKESLSPRLRFRPKGEEVDGSFLFDLRVFLMEAKWHKDPLPASSIYTFRGKVEGKLAGTLGVFISMSGFSESAVDALTAGKVANVLLFDGDDVRACLTHGFTAVLRTKLRAAAEAGVVFYRFMSAQPARSNEGASSRPVTTDISRSDRGPRLFVVCEGPADVTVLSALAQRVVETSLATSTIRIVAAGGKLGLARVANAVSGLLDPAGKILIVADSDGEPEKIAREIEDGLRADSAEVIIVEPQLEIWLAAGASDPRGQIREEARRRGQAMTSLLQGAANEISLEALAKSSQSFRKFRDFLLAEVGERAEE